MTRLLTAVFLFASFNAVADDLRTFSNGQVINADDFNHNFQKLEQDIADIPAGPQGPVGNNGAVGPAGPAGADGVAAGLNCTTDQSIVYRGGAWVCSSPQIVEQVFLGPADKEGGDITCPSPKKVTAGGCVFRGLGDCSRTESRPEYDLSGWYCEADGGGYCEVENIYAICQ